MTDVFISYARADRNRVRLIALGLTAEGFSVWWDPNIKPGSKWNDAIRKSLEGAAAVVTCWSPASIKSNWVIAETTHASNDKKLVPCMVRMCNPPMPFNMIQSADLSNWNGDADNADWVLFLRQIKRLIEAKRRAAAAIPPPGEAHGREGAPPASASAPEPVATYVRSSTRPRLGPSFAGMALTAVAITALLTAGWWALENRPWERRAEAPESAAVAEATPAPATTEPAPPATPPEPAGPTPTRMQIRAASASGYYGYDLDTGAEILAVPGDDRTQWGLVDFVLFGMPDEDGDYHFMGVAEGSQFAAAGVTPAPTRAVCEGLAYSNQAVRLPETDISGRAYCVRTNQGRLAYLYVRSGPGGVPGALDLDVTLLD